jgi:hypothetical protein
VNSSINPRPTMIAHRTLGDMESPLMRIADLAASGVELLAQSNPKVTAILDSILDTAMSLEMLRAAAWSESKSSCD